MLPRSLAALVPVVALACAPAADERPERPQPGDHGDGGSGAGDGGQIDGGASGTDSGDGGGQDGGGQDGGDTGSSDPDALFNLDAVHVVSLTIPDAGVAALGREPYEYVEADLSFDGQSFPSVGVRIKGRLGSLRSLSQKAGLKIDLLEFGQKDRLEGQKKLNFNNMVQDCAKTKELMAYGAYQRAGGHAPGLGYAHVTVNGVDHGLYSLVEVIDDEFIEARFPDDGEGGNLYDGDYVLWDDGSYTLLDLTWPSIDLFQQDEGDDASKDDLRALVAGVEAVGAGQDFTGTLAPLLDIDRYLRFFAAEVWVGQYDGYSFYTNNYRLYFDPRDGLAQFIPWDPDWAFYASTPLTSPYSKLSQGCRADPTCLDGFRTALADLIPLVQDGALAAENAVAWDLIEPYLRDDPMLETRFGEIQSCQAAMNTWLETRDNTLNTTPGL